MRKQCAGQNSNATWIRTICVNIWRDCPKSSALRRMNGYWRVLKNMSACIEFSIFIDWRKLDHAARLIVDHHDEIEDFGSLYLEIIKWLKEKLAEFAASCRPIPRSFEADLRYGNRTIALGIGLCIQAPSTVHASVHRCKMSFNQSRSLRLLAYSVFLVHFAISISTNISLRK